MQGSALAALKGTNPKLGRESILELMKAVDTYLPTPPRAVDKPFLMSVESVLSVPGRGTVATGRIELGAIKVGEDVELMGYSDAHMKSTVTGYACGAGFGMP